MDNILRINLDEKYKIKIDSLDESEADNEKLFFYDVYIKAIKALNDIVQASNDANKDEKDINDVFSKERNEFNNIIAFTGERGTGKTSAMVSFAKFLNIKVKNVDGGFTMGNSIFHSLGIVDPSLFEERENIFEVIISELFARFKEKLEKGNNEYDNIKKVELLKLFDSVYESIRIIRNDINVYDGEALDSLNKLSIGARLRSNLKNLIKVYLEFMDSTCGKTTKNSLLVISIDDFDLNVKEATYITEQVRKYLMIPNVVILMAVNIEQLANVKEQSLRNEFTTMINAKRMFEDPKEMALRYLLKLIPEERRLVLPDIKILGKDVVLEISNENSEIQKNDLMKVLRLYDKEDISISELDKLNLFLKTNNLNQQDDVSNKDHHKVIAQCIKILNKKNTLEESILKIIYEKTNLIFIKPENSSHYLVPSCLREIREFLLFLNNMESIDMFQLDSSKQQKRLESNINSFKQFFLNSWIKANIADDFIKVINEFDSTDIALKNKFIITRTIDVLRRRFNVKDSDSDINVVTNYLPDNKLRDFKELDFIIDRANKPRCISLGDVLFFLNQLKFYRNNPVINKYVFAIETLYSFMFSRRITSFATESKQLNIYKNDIDMLINSFINAPMSASNILLRHKRTKNISSSTLSEIKYTDLPFELMKINKSSNINDSDINIFQSDSVVNRGLISLSKNNRTDVDYLRTEGHSSNYLFYLYSCLLPRLNSEENRIYSILPLYSIELFSKLWNNISFKISTEKNGEGVLKSIVEKLIKEKTSILKEYSYIKDVNEIKDIDELLLNNDFVKIAYDSLFVVYESVTKDLLKQIDVLLDKKDIKLNYFNTSINSAIRVFNSLIITYKLSSINDKYLFSLIEETIKQFEESKISEKDVDIAISTNKRITSNLEDKLNLSQEKINEILEHAKIKINQIKSNIELINE